MLVSLGVSALAAPVLFRLLVAMKSRQTVSAHLKEHAHKQGTPTMGGIIVLIGLLAGMAAVWQPGFLAPLVLILGFGLVGFLDDYLMPRWKPGSRGLSWLPKLGLEIGACLVAAFFMGWTDPAAVGVFVFMVLFLSNAYNFSDGLDTLAGGLGMILAFGLAVFCYFLDAATWEAFAGMELLVVDPAVPLTCLVLGVAFAPFLILNAAPAKVFMGDVGALPIGAVFGWVVSSLMFRGGGEAGLVFDAGATVAIGIVLLVMLVEIVPVPLQIASVKIRKKRLFPFKTPVHHAFQDAGWPETRIAMLFHMVQLGLVVGGCALVSTGWGG